MRKKTFNQQNLSLVRFDNNKIPEFKEVRGRDWISAGDKNDYFDYLTNLFNRSAKHNAIVTGKVIYIKGQGFDVVDKSNPVNVIKAQTWLNNLNDYDTANDLLQKVTTDEEIYGGCYLLATPNLGRTAVARLEHVEYSKIRVSKCNRFFYYSEDWSKYRQSPETTGLKVIQPYNRETKSGLYYYKSYRPGCYVYALPEYVGAIPYIEIDFEISNYHLNNIKNGFSAGTMLSFNSGTPSAEEQQIIEGKIKHKFTGSDKAGQLMITFSENKDSAPTVTSLLPNDFDKQFIQLNETVMQEIFTGHKITSLSLFGIKEANGLGSKDELANAFQLLQNTYISNKQDIIAGIFNDFAEDSGLGRPFYIKKVKPVGSWLSFDNIVQVMTPDEIRKEAGLPPLSGNTQMKTCCGSEKMNIETFKKFGVPKSEYEVVKSVQFESKEEAYIGEINFYRSGFADVQVMYSYEEKKNLPPLIGEHREFCQELIDLERLYTRDEINQISEIEGRDVWTFRGGFYHNPETGRTSPSCRHIWSQNVVKKK